VREQGAVADFLTLQASGGLDEYDGIYGLLCIDTHGNTPALAELHLSEKARRRAVSFIL
jgi:hypothetical protein